MAVASEMGVEFTEVRYMKDFPDAETLRELIAKLEEPVENLVRKDAQFAKLGLNEVDYVDDVDAVVEVLGKYHRLLQRPILVGPDQAIIGRPFEGVMAKTRVAEMLSPKTD